MSMQQFSAPRKALNFSLLLFFLFIALEANAQQWYLLGPNVSGDQIFVDTEKMQADGDIVRFYQRTDLATPQSNGLFKKSTKQVVNKWLLNCRTQTASLTEKHEFSEIGEAINSQTWSEATSVPIAFSPGSIGSFFSSFACGRGREIIVSKSKGTFLNPRLLQAKWRSVGTADGVFLSVADELVSPGKDSNEGYTLYVQRVDYQSPRQVGNNLVQTVLVLMRGNCEKRETLIRYDANFDSRGRLLHRVEYPDLKPTSVVDGGPGGLALDEICVRSSKLAKRDSEEASKSDSKSTNASKDSDSTPKISTGTAWYSVSGYFVTAYHVIERAKNVFLYGQDKIPIKVRVVAADAKNDVAILLGETKDRSIQPIPFSKSPPVLGSRVFTIGYPHSNVLGVSPKVTSGELSGNLPLDPTKVLISVPVQSGNSGGPLINMAGEAVGLVIEKLSAPELYKATGDSTENMNFALKLRYIEALIEDQPRLTVEVEQPKSKSVALEDLVNLYKGSVFFVVAQ